MSTNYSANQYDGAFRARKLINWEVPDQKREHSWHPRTHSGYTRFITNDRGHIVEPSRRSEDNPWTKFVGTWDLPKKIPGNRVRVPTGRSVAAQLETEHKTQWGEHFTLAGHKDELRLYKKEHGPPYTAANTRTMNPIPPREPSPERTPSVPICATPPAMEDPSKPAHFEPHADLPPPKRHEGSKPPTPSPLPPKSASPMNPKPSPFQKSPVPAYEPMSSPPRPSEPARNTPPLQLD